MFEEIIKIVSDKNSDSIAQYEIDDKDILIVEKFRRPYEVIWFDPNIQSDENQEYYNILKENGF